MKTAVRLIEAVNEWIGRAVSWLAVLMVFTTFTVAVLRYGVGVGFVWMQESYVWMHATVFMAASGYTLLHDGHVRIDVIYAGMSARRQAWINLLGVLFLLTPMLGAVWWVAFPYVTLSWERLETSPDVGGLPGLFLLKSVMLVFVALLGLQGVALALRSLLTLRGEACAPPPGAHEEPGV